VTIDESGILLAFDPSEYAARLGLLRHRMEAAKIDAVICVSPATLYYFCGYDGQSYGDDQALVITLDERPPILILRDIDLSLANDIAGGAWGEKQPYRYPNEDPARIALGMLAAALKGGEQRIGLEEDQWYLSARYYRRFLSCLPEGWQLRDASELVNAVRFVKRSAEWHYIREAAEIAANGLEAARCCARAGIREVEFAAEIEYATRRLGSGAAGIPTFVESGPRTVAAHSAPTDRKLGHGEPVRCAFASVRRRYQVTTYQAFHISEPSRAYRQAFEGCREALDVLKVEIRSGAVIGACCRSARTTLNRHGLSAGNMGRWGYGLGIAFPPSWAQPYAINEPSTRLFEPGMMFCLHVTMSLPAEGFGFTLGANYTLTEHGLERVNHDEPDLIVVA
jgi:Xaa-Pro dipeptidase